MKTAISVPDATFHRVEEIARRHGMNRSQFYAAAAARYADELQSADVTESINAVLDSCGVDESAAFALDAAAVMSVDEW